MNKAGNNAAYVKTLAVFDTIATYAQGRIVDKRTHQSIKGARIPVRYCSAFHTEVETKTAKTDENGLFNLGWVGSNGTKGPQSNRFLLVEALGYESIRATTVAFGASAYLHIELMPTQKPK